MALTTSLTRKIDIPHEPGEFIVFRMPSWVDLETAREERTRKQFSNMRMTREVLGPDVIEEMRLENAKLQEAKEADTKAIAVKRTAEEVLGEFDKLLLLKTGIAGWSYDAPVSVEAISALDEQTAKWAGLTLAALAESGFDAILPDVTMNDRGNVIDVSPGVDADPLASSSSSTATSMEIGTNGAGPTLLHAVGG